jgi:glucokinase
MLIAGDICSTNVRRALVSPEAGPRTGLNLQRITLLNDLKAIACAVPSLAAGATATINARRAENHFCNGVRLAPPPGGPVIKEGEPVTGLAAANVLHHEVTELAADRRSAPDLGRTVRAAARA